MDANEVVYRLRNIRDGMAHNDDNLYALSAAASYIEANDDEFNEAFFVGEEIGIVLAKPSTSSAVHDSWNFTLDEDFLG